MDKLKGLREEIFLKVSGLRKLAEELVEIKQIKDKEKSKLLPQEQHLWHYLIKRCK